MDLYLIQDSCLFARKRLMINPSKWQSLTQVRSLHKGQHQIPGQPSIDQSHQQALQLTTNVFTKLGGRCNGTKKCKVISAADWCLDCVADTT